MVEPVDRVLAEIGDPELLDQLAGLAGTDLTTLLLAVMKQRTARVAAADVIRRYRDDRFVAPGTMGLAVLRETESLLLDSVSPDFEQIVLSPLTPTGAHSTVARVSQNNLVSTVRNTDVAGDPTVGLALEAAIRRLALWKLDPKSTTLVRLATVQRVVRAQTFEGPDSFPHFTILGLVTAGRDTGNYEFETSALAEHGATLATAVLGAEADEAVLSISDWTGGGLSGVAELAHSRVANPRLVVTEDPKRNRARGYYHSGAIELSATFGDKTFSAADGGLVAWTTQLMGSDKERLMISGIGVDRIALSRGG